MLLSLAIFLISFSDLHDLLGLALGLLNLLPRLLLFHFQEGNTVGKQFGIVGRLLFIHTSFLEGASDFFLLIFFVPVWVLLVVLLAIGVLFLLEFLSRMLLGLWNGLRLLWRFDVIWLGVWIHCVLLVIYNTRESQCDSIELISRPFLELMELLTFFNLIYKERENNF